jgi:predicted ArsR family transcriptional regulator
LTDQGIPTEVRQLIADHIDSVLQLEVLLLLLASPDREFSVEDLATELRVDVAFVSEQLANLCNRGMLTCRTEGRPLYKYGPRTPELDRAIQGLRVAYADRRVSVISLIFAKPVDKLRSFADAFRLRKDQ